MKRLYSIKREIRAFFAKHFKVKTTKPRTAFGFCALRFGFPALSAYACLLLILPLVAAARVQAQYSAGVLGGWSSATLRIADEDGELSARQGVAVGGALAARFNRTVSLQAEPMYLQKGGVLQETESDLTATTFTFKANYLEVPVLLKLATGKSIRPYLVAGPTVGFLLSSAVEAGVADLTFTGNLDNITRSVDFGVSAGAGLGFSLDYAEVFFEGRYTRGLRNINNGGEVQLRSGNLVLNDTLGNNEVQTTGWQVLAGLAFPIGKKE